MFIRNLPGIVFITLALAVSPLTAQQQIASTQAAPPGIKQPGWLGLWVQPLPQELKAQLAHLTLSGEGLMVARVEHDSPAQKSGIQKFDVLVSFADQKLFTPEQLSSLVNNFNAENQVELQIIHQGQLKTINTTLGANKKRTLARTHRHPRPYPSMPMHQAPRLPQPLQPPLNSLADDSSAWDEFESVEVKTLPDGRYHARVILKDQSNETRTFTFEGKKQEIIQQINQLQELPGDKKRALLQALNLQPGQFTDWNNFGLDHFGFTRDFFNSPMFNRNLFDQNRFNQNPFDQPFFRDPYYLDRYYSDSWGRRGYPPPWQFHFYPDRPDWNHRP